MANERSQGDGQNDRSQRQQVDRGAGNDLSERGMRAERMDQSSWQDQQDDSELRLDDRRTRDTFQADRQPQENQPDPGRRGEQDQNPSERQFGSQRTRNESWPDESSDEDEDRDGV